jgi:hypothetical protein
MMLASAIGNLIVALLVALAVIVVITLAGALIYRARRRGRARQGNWDSGAREACAAAEALSDRLATRLNPTQSANGALPAGLWSDTERSMDELGTRLQALRFSAPNYTTDQAMEELIMALAALRSALQVDHGARAATGVPAGEPVTTAQARLMELDSAVRNLKATI